MIDLCCFEWGKWRLLVSTSPGYVTNRDPEIDVGFKLANMQGLDDKEDSMLYQLSDVWHIELQMPLRFLH